MHWVSNPDQQQSLATGQFQIISGRANLNVCYQGLHCLGHAGGNFAAGPGRLGHPSSFLDPQARASSWQQRFCCVGGSTTIFSCCVQPQDAVPASQSYQQLASSSAGASSGCLTLTRKHIFLLVVAAATVQASLSSSFIGPTSSSHIDMTVTVP
jgi:hypothetical protein